MSSITAALKSKSPNTFHIQAYLVAGAVRRSELNLQP